MEREKLIKLSFEDPDINIIKFNKQEIKVSSYLSLAEQILLIRNYLSIYFHSFPEDLDFTGETPHNPIQADVALKYQIIQLATNIDHTELGVDNLLNVLWEKISDSIINYNEFKARLDQVVADVEKEIALNQSLGVIIDHLASRADNLFDRIASLLEKLDDNNIEKLKEVGKEMLKEVQDSPMADIFKEAVSQEQTNIVKSKRRGRPKKVE